MRHEAVLWKSIGDNMVECGLCAHRCKIAEGGFGFCGMRKNEGGELYTYAYGRVIANHVDPIEKKPFYHFLPGSYAYSIATIGCNFRCGFCQNWNISQASLRSGDIEGYELKPEEVVREAVKNGCKSVSYTYTEPTIFFEYAYDTARIAKEKGLYNTFVTNGYMTAETVEMISPYLDAANVDLKSFRDQIYKSVCMASLDPVLGSIKKMKDSGIWVEVTTLVVPGMNDSKGELRDIAAFIAGVDKGIPWHISRFHPDYKYVDTPPTPMEKLREAAEIGKDEGLKYVYLGNVLSDSDTVCPECGKVVVERTGFGIAAAPDIAQGGRCGSCGAMIEGFWE